MNDWPDLLRLMLAMSHPYDLLAQIAKLRSHERISGMNIAKALGVAPSGVTRIPADAAALEEQMTSEDFTFYQEEPSAARFRSMWDWILEQQVKSVLDDLHGWVNGLVDNLSDNFRRLGPPDGLKQKERAVLGVIFAGDNVPAVKQTLLAAVSASILGMPSESTHRQLRDWIVAHPNQIQRSPQAWDAIIANIIRIPLALEDAMLDEEPKHDSRRAQLLRHLETSFAPETIERSVMDHLCSARSMMDPTDATFWVATQTLGSADERLAALERLSSEIQRFGRRFGKADPE